MTGSTAGLLILVLAGVMNASFTLPMKYAHRWAWENTWLAWSIFALLVLPVAVTCGTVPHLRAVYHATPSAILLDVILFGAGWGVAQVFFGLAVDAIGIALTFSLVLGTSAAVGTLVPLLRLHPERLNTPAGKAVLVGVAVVIAGVAVCAVAGRRREKAVARQTGPRKNATAGLVLAILCGFGASFVNFGLAFGAPLIRMTQVFGAGALNAANAVWMPLMLAGAVPNVLYCVWLLRRNRTGAKFGAGRTGHWLLALVMAVFWFGSTVLYGLSTVQLGAWGPILGWPLFLSWPTQADIFKSGDFHLYALSLDMGGTHIGCAVVRDDQIAACASMETEGAHGLASLLPRVAETMRRLLDESGAKAEGCGGVAIGYPGIVDVWTGRILSTLKKYEDAMRLDLAAWSKDTFGLKLRMEKNAGMVLLGAHAQAACPDGHVQRAGIIVPYIQQHVQKHAWVAWKSPKYGLRFSATTRRYWARFRWCWRSPDGAPIKLRQVSGHCLRFTGRVQRGMARDCRSSQRPTQAAARAVRRVLPGRVPGADQRCAP